MTKRITIIATLTAVALVLLYRVGWHRADDPRPADGVTVVDTAGRVVVDARSTPIPAPAAVPPVASIMAEGPDSLKALHDSAAPGAADRDPAAERRVNAAFLDDPAFRSNPVTVSCTARRCEVHGTTGTDEVETRLAIRGNAFLDRIEGAGYLAGTDIVRRTAAGSEYVVYLEPRN